MKAKASPTAIVAIRVMSCGTVVSLLKRSPTASVLEAVSGLENPPCHGEADGQEQERHGEAQGDADVGRLEEAPAEAADEVDDRIGERDFLPEGRQHADRIEGAAKEGERRQDEERHELQLLEAVGPDADD